MFSTQSAEHFKKGTDCWNRLILKIKIFLINLCLSHTPVLCALKFDQPFKIAVNASEASAVAALLQKDGFGVDRPMGYFSKKVNHYQRNYSTIEKETQNEKAHILALQHFEVYVAVSLIVIDTNDKTNFLHRSANQHLMSWSLFLHV